MPTFAKSAVKYLRESKEELEKVTWPSRKDTVRYSVLVMTSCVLLAAYFGLLDFALNAALGALLTLIA